MLSLGKLTLIISLVCATLAQATIYLPAHITRTSIKKVPNARLQIAWDIHDVLAVKEKGNFFTKVGIGFSYLFGNQGWDEIERISAQGDISGEGKATILKKNGHGKVAKMLSKVANSYKPRKGMEQVVQEIRKAGITQRLASNIGQNFLANLKVRFKTKHHCALFDIIQPGKIINFANYAPLSRKLTQNPPHLTSYSKPHPIFYKDFNTTYNPENTDTIIFIDDKIENIRAAVKAGWVGIHFDAHSKNAVNSLRADLAMLGIFSKK